MTSKNRIIFKIEGPEQNNHHLELSVFVDKTKQFLDLLKSSSKDSGEDNAVFHVVRLSHSSPATIECEPKGQHTTPSAVTAFESVRRNLDLAINEEAHNLSNPVLSNMEKLAQFNHQKISWAEIHVISDDAEGEHIYKLNDHFREILRMARSAEEKVISTIDGKLEQINIHKNANTFTIYTSLPHISSVACKFPDDLLGNVQSALGKFVSISGECTYRPEALAPYKINVQEMNILPPSRDLPSLDDLCGIAPDATEGKPSEQFVRELRDKWCKGVK